MQKDRRNATTHVTAPLGEATATTLVSTTTTTEAALSTVGLWAHSGNVTGFTTSELHEQLQCRD
jgi:hypothetical protein